MYRQLVAAGMLEVESEHGGLRLAPAAWPVLRGEQGLELRRDPTPSRATARRRSPSAPPEPASSAPVDRELFDVLRALRLKLARAQNVPPYIIFHDRTLLEMASLRPTSREAMAEISGVGEAKLSRYSEAFLEVIRQSGS